MAELYGVPEPEKPLPADVLQAQLRDIHEREQQIEYILLHAGMGTEYQIQELRSELRILKETRANIELQLHPPEKDPFVEQRQAERRVKQDAYVKQLFAEDPFDVIAARKAEAAEQRRRAIEFAVKEQTEHLLAFIDRLEAEGDFRQAKLWRLQMVNLRADIERRLR